MKSIMSIALDEYVAKGGVLPKDDIIAVRYNEQGQQEFVMVSECESEVRDGKA